MRSYDPNFAKSNRTIPQRSAWLIQMSNYHVSRTTTGTSIYSIPIVLFENPSPVLPSYGRVTVKAASSITQLYCIRQILSPFTASKTKDGSFHTTRNQEYLHPGSRHSDKYNDSRPDTCNYHNLCKASLLHSCSVPSFLSKQPRNNHSLDFMIF